MTHIKSLYPAVFVLPLFLALLFVPAVALPSAVLIVGLAPAPKSLPACFRFKLLCATNGVPAFVLPLGLLAAALLLLLGPAPPAPDPDAPALLFCGIDRCCF